MQREVIPDVILLHGLWMPGLVMSPLAARLAARGFRTHLFGYAGRSERLDTHAELLCRFARKAVGGAPVHFVAHSLGGLVVLAALGGPHAAAHAVSPAGVVLLGTPVRGCMAGRRFAHSAAGRWMLGESASLWRESRTLGRGGKVLPSFLARWDGRVPLGIVAGSHPSFGIGRMLGRLPGVNDGVVRLEETEIEGMTERIVLPVGHTQLIFSRRVAVQTAQFLAKGAFEHAE